MRFQVLMLLFSCYCKLMAAQPIETYKAGLDSSNPLLCERILMEINNSRSSAFRGVVFEYLKKNEAGECNWPSVLSYMNNNDETILRDVIDIYQKNQVGLANTLIVLLNQGARTEGVKNFIHSELLRQNLKETDELYLRLALIITDSVTDGNLGRTEELLKNHTPGTASAILLLGCVECQGRIPERISEVLQKYVTDPNRIEESYYSAMALSRNENIEHIKIIENASQRAWNEKEYMSAVLYDFCAARLDAAMADKKIHKALKYLGSSEDNNHTDYYVWLLTRIITNQSMRLYMTKELYHEDLDTIKGSLLYCARFPFPEYTMHKMRILELLETASDETVRKLAAMALAMAARRDDVKTIESLACRETSRDVQKEIKRSVNIILLQDIRQQEAKAVR